MNNQRLKIFIGILFVPVLEYYHVRKKSTNAKTYRWFLLSNISPSHVNKNIGSCSRRETKSENSDNAKVINIFKSLYTIFLMVLRKQIVHRWRSFIGIKLANFFILLLLSSVFHIPSLPPSCGISHTNCIRENFCYYLPPRMIVNS